MKNIAARRSRAKWAVIAGLGVALLAVAAVPSLRWRAHLSFLYAAGQIPDLAPADFVAFMAPGSTQSLTRMIETRDPYAVIRNPLTSESALLAGAQRFKAACASCHAPDGSGTSQAPALVGRAYKHGESDWALYRTIRYGVPNTAMAPHPLPDEQLWQLAAHLRILRAKSEGAPAMSKGDQPQSLPLPYAELQALQAPGEDWLTYSGTYNSQRNSSLDQINRGNVGQLSVKWVHQFEGETGFVEAAPIVRSGVMYVTLSGGRVLALDARNGHTIWERPAEPGAGHNNRGVAIMDDRIFVGTGKGHLRALSAKTGAILWDSSVGDSKTYFISGAPLAYRDLVVTGVGTIDGGRGFVVAYDAATGRERWRFVTIPAPGEPGNETWAGESWREGGAPTWLTGSYDPETDSLYWGVGNPKPDYDTSARKGDNLYSNSVLSLNGSTGKLQWHFQFTPADDHDWDANQVPLLVDRPGAGGLGKDKLMLWANRNGYYYVLNRETGKFLSGTPFARQTWSEGLDAQGRPRPVPASAANNKGVMIYPGNTGATNWWSPSYDAALNLVYVPTLEQGMVYFPSDASTGKSAKSSWPSGAGRSLYTAVRALDAASGKLVWEHREAPRLDDNVAGGLLATKGGLLFGSDRSTFFALDARAGNKLWQFETGGKINAAPVTYGVQSEQYVAIAAGNSLFAFGQPGTARGARGAAIAARP